jgi:hypothetical protein
MRTEQATNEATNALEKLGLKVEQLCAMLTVCTDESFKAHTDDTKEGYLFACADIAQECERLLTALEATHA